MRIPTDEQIRGALIGIISDGFNRSIGALEDAGAIDTTVMRAAYTGVDSWYYDLVTEQIEKTAEWSVLAIRQLLDLDVKVNE